MAAWNFNWYWLRVVFDGAIRWPSFYVICTILFFRFYLIKIKDLYMTALEKRGSVVITEMEILAHMGYTIYLALSHFPFWPVWFLYWDINLFSFRCSFSLANILFVGKVHLCPPVNVIAVRTVQFDVLMVGLIDWLLTLPLANVLISETLLLHQPDFHWLRKWKTAS